jgi:hypothetical protein
MRLKRTIGSSATSTKISSDGSLTITYGSGVNSLACGTTSTRAISITAASTGMYSAWAKERALQAYRDQETRALRESARILDQEGWMHERWRRRRNMPRPTLAAPSTVEPVLDVWKLPPSKHGGPTPPVDDPTMRTLGQIISGLEADAENFV